MSSKLGRRRFLKYIAGGGAAALLIPRLGGLLDKQSPALAQTSDKVQVQRRWMMVVDLRKCEGCVTIDKVPGCVQHCIEGHYVPEGQQWIQVYEGELAGGTFFMPTPCQQCENAPCVNVCPVGATFTTKEGIVLIDHERCIGCRFCMAACPYQRRFFNWGEPELPPEAHFIQYSPEYPVPAKKGTVIKCVFCAHLIKDGKLPHCVTGCPMGALYFGDLEEGLATNGVEIVELRRFLSENNATRYKEDLGTQPRVWYIPGHGQAMGRHPDDPRKPKEPTWPWGQKGE